MQADNQRVTSVEWQVDGLVGPTHNYAGLSFGNVASDIHKFSVSNPREAALQGISKMRYVEAITHAQSFFVPHYRPIVSELKRLGFGGNTAYMLSEAARVAPELLASVFSSSAMWAANAATVAPSVDTADGKVHFTPANLVSKFHRMVESPFTTRVLKRMFADERFFVVHEPLPATLRFADEGAANHMRVVPRHGEAGVHVFVYGTTEGATRVPRCFPARQHEEASRAVARLHGLDPSRCLFVQQAPEAIDAGVFHHDVIGLNSLYFMAHHESALVDGPAAIAALRQKAGDNAFYFKEVKESELSLAAAVKSYFFNSQLISSEQGIHIIAPMECRENEQAAALFARWVQEDGPVAAVHYLDVRESMKNGGGPACLRLRVVLTEQESAAMHQGVVLTPEKADALEAWVKRYYRDRLSIDDLRDVQLINEVEEALDALSQLVGMPLLYPFQQ